MTRRRTPTTILLALAMTCILITGSAATESFSDKLTRQLEARRSEATRSDSDVDISIYGETPLPPGTDRRTVLKTRAVLFEKVADHGRAEKCFADALAIQPVDPSLYLDRGYYRLRRARYEDAIADFTSGAQLDPRRGAFSFAIGRAQVALGDHEAAVASYAEALRIDPRDARALLARAEAHVNLGRFSEAMHDYGRALREKLVRRNDRFFARLGRGYAALMLRDYAAAIVEFDEALAIESNAFNAMVWRGYANELSGRTDRAITDYERALAYDPADATMRAHVKRLRSKAIASPHSATFPYDGIVTGALAVPRRGGPAPGR